MPDSGVNADQHVIEKTCEIEGKMKMINSSRNADRWEFVKCNNSAEDAKSPFNHWHRQLFGAERQKVNCQVEDCTLSLEMSYFISWSLSPASESLKIDT